MTKERKTVKWIPCSQDLPAQHECIEDDLRWMQSVDVLATDGHRYYVACTEDDTWIDSYYGSILNGIIAWMPLPDLYKGEHNEID